MKGSHRSISYRLFLTISSVAAAPIISLLGSYLLGTGESYPGANYAYTFYGLAFGGKPWPEFYADFPQAISLSEVEQGALAYRAAFAEIVRNPLGLLSGLWLFFKIYLNHLFIYIDFPILRPVSEMLAFCGLTVAGFRARKEPHLSFLFCGAVGVVLSTPFLFWTMDAYRAFIATAPFEAVAISVGLATIIDTARSLLCSDQRSQSLTPAWLHGHAITVTTTAVGGLLAIGATVAPVVALALHTTPRFANTTCDGSLKPFIIHLGKSSPFIEIVPDQGNVTHVPKVTYHDFHADNSFANVEISEALREMKPGDLLIHGYDLIRGATTNPAEHAGFKRFHWLIASASQMPTLGRYYLVCGQTNRLPAQQKRFPVLFVENAREIAPLKD
jgi:hypothetical protein